MPSSSSSSGSLSSSSTSSSLTALRLSLLQGHSNGLITEESIASKLQSAVDHLEAETVLQAAANDVCSGKKKEWFMLQEDKSLILAAASSKNTPSAGTPFASVSTASNAVTTGALTASFTPLAQRLAMKLAANRSSLGNSAGSDNGTSSTNERDASGGLGGACRWVEIDGTKAKVLLFL